MPSAAIAILINGLLICGLSFASAQTPTPIPPMPDNASPAFEVVTIRPTDTSAPHGTFIRHNGRHIVAYNMSVARLIVFAYSLQSRQIAGAPRRLLDTHFDIDGVPDIDGHPNPSQTRLMFQKLLVSRFKLAFHYEPRDLPVYAFLVAKSGPKLMPTTSKPGDSTSFSYACPPVLTVRNYSVSDFAKGMQDAFLDKPVVDQTGLHGRYDFDLRWSPDDSATYCPASPAGFRNDPGAPPDLYTAIQEQIGLKIVPTRAPVPVMVIDHVEMPSEN